MVEAYDVERLKTLLAAATPGMWRVHGPGEDGTVYIDADDEGDRPVAMMMSGSPHNQDIKDAALIVAAVKALSALLARAQIEVSQSDRRVEPVPSSESAQRAGEAMYDRWLADHNDGFAAPPPLSRSDMAWADIFRAGYESLPPTHAADGEA